MKKVLLISEREQLPKGAFDFACILNEISPILLTGAFLPADTYLDNLLYYSGGMAAPLLYYTPADDVVVTDAAIADFKERCMLNHIDYGVHEKGGLHLSAELRKETRFADLLLLSNQRFYENPEQFIFNDYIEDTLLHTECPILILPETFARPEYVVLAYDGTPSSVFAIKQYAMLFPEFAGLETMIVYMHMGEHDEIPDIDYIEELAGRHFTNLTFFKAGLNPKKHFTQWLEGSKNTLLVTGSFGRGRVAQMFHKSFVSDILKAHKMPVFVAHK